jgi:hypothetical protein
MDGDAFGNVLILAEQILSVGPARALLTCATMEPEFFPGRE